jgi:hypothetical protein
MVTIKGEVFQFPGPISFAAPHIFTPVVAMDSTGVQ